MIMFQKDCPIKTHTKQMVKNEIIYKIKEKNFQRFFSYPWKATVTNNARFQKLRIFSRHNLSNNEPIGIKNFSACLTTRGVILFYVENISDCGFSRFCLENRFASKGYNYRQIYYDAYTTVTSRT